jgi:hypothetical protein
MVGLWRRSALVGQGCRPSFSNVVVNFEWIAVLAFATEYELGDEFSQTELKEIVEKVRPELDPWIEKCKEIAAGLPEEFRSIYIASAQKFKRDLLHAPDKPAKPKRKPKTIKEALKRAAESGTHSILDIQRISAKPKFGAITLFPQSRLVEFFGTEKPTPEKIRDVYESGALEEFICERWEGIYLIGYREKVPVEIFFAGCSGD